ncbi:MAG: NAD-dependent epimerase/dehydratase family protein, partial [Acidobacteriota bacterium]
IDQAPYRSADRVWFLAWDTGGAKYHSATEKQHQMYRHNCELAARVFDALSATRRPFLFVTSQLAGQQTAYGLTKLMAETWAGQLGGRIARLWNTYGWEDPDSRSHVITDLVISGLTEGAVRMMTTGRERRRFIYKTDCARLLRSFFDSDQMRIDIAGPEWIRIEELAAEVARQLRLPILRGSLQGEEILIDPEIELPSHQIEVSLAAGVELVIEEARSYLSRRAAD